MTPRPRPGRPSGHGRTPAGRSPAVTTRQPADLVAALDARCERDGLTRSEAVGMALAAWLARD